jgi:hypothetical protein
MRVFTITLIISLFAFIGQAAGPDTSGDLYTPSGLKKGAFLYKKDNTHKIAISSNFKNTCECKMLEKGSSLRSISYVFLNNKDVSLVLMSGPASCMIKGEFINDNEIQLELNNFKLKYRKYGGDQFTLKVPKELMIPPGVD